MLDHILGDLLENYCWNDDLMNFARVLFSISILLTFPIECFVSREVSQFLYSISRVYFMFASFHNLDCKDSNTSI